MKAMPGEHNTMITSSTADPRAHMPHSNASNSDWERK